MSRDSAMVANAGDRRQVRHASRAERDREQDERNDMIAVLSTAEGRRVMWRVLSHCSVFGTVFHPSNSHMSHASGKQDVGHWLMGRITDADQGRLFQMMQEAQQRQAKESEINRAARTPSVTEEVEDVDA